MYNLFCFAESYLLCFNQLFVFLYLKSHTANIMKVNLPLPYLGKDFLCEITLALLEFFLCPCVGDMPSGRL